MGKHTARWTVARQIQEVRAARAAREAGFLQEMHLIYRGRHADTDKNAHFDLHTRQLFEREMKLEQQ